MDAPPGIDAVRPSHCPRCHAASRPLGGALVLHGHGFRVRRVRGPVTPGGPAEDVELRLRRYRCQRCRAVIVVSPAGVVAGLLYSLMAVGLAFALYGIQRASHPQVRARVSPWPASDRDPARTSWVTLVRWVDAVREGRLFVGLRRPPLELTRREVAEAVALRLADAAAPTAPSRLARVFAGSTAPFR